MPKIKASQFSQSVHRWVDRQHVGKPLGEIREKVEQAARREFKRHKDWEPAAGERTFKAISAMAVKRHQRNRDFFNRFRF